MFYMATLSSHCYSRGNHAVAMESSLNCSRIKARDDDALKLLASRVAVHLQMFCVFSNFPPLCWFQTGHGNSVTVALDAASLEIVYARSTGRGRETERLDDMAIVLIYRQIALQQSTL
jgi:hypothetical protein